MVSVFLQVASDTSSADVLIAASWHYPELGDASEFAKSSKVLLS